MRYAMDCTRPNAPIPSPHKVRGFTLIELMIIVTLLGIFAAFAIPSFTQFINNNRTQSANNEVLALLQYARSTAVAQRTTISVCPDDDVWEVKAKDCTGDSLRSVNINAGMSIAASAEALSFRHNGSASTPATIRTCYKGDASNGYTINVAGAGSIRTYPRGMENGADSMASCESDEAEEEEEDGDEG